MKGITYLVLAIAVLSVLIIGASGCVQNPPTCNKPYILVGTECCLDQNDNSICDKDEGISNQSSQSSSSENQS